MSLAKDASSTVYGLKQHDGKISMMSWVTESHALYKTQMMAMV
jgi:hypothetical protein